MGEKKRYYMKEFQAIQLNMHHNLNAKMKKRRLIPTDGRPTCFLLQKY